MPLRFNIPEAEELINSYQALPPKGRRKSLANLLSFICGYDPADWYSLKEPIVSADSLRRGIVLFPGATSDMLYASLVRLVLTATLDDQDRQFFLTELWRASELINSRTPKPRNTQRDREIVRLHDEEGLTFGRIAQRLPTPNGKRLKRDTVERAYHRMKSKPQD